MQPNGSTQEIKHGKYRKRHRDKEKRAIQQGNLPSADKISNPYGIIQ